MLAIHSSGSIAYYLCLFMQTWFQPDCYIYIYTNETHYVCESIPTFASIHPCNYKQYKWPKVGIIFCVFMLKNVFHLCMHRYNYPAGIAFAINDTNSHVVANATWRVGSQQFLSNICSSTSNINLHVNTCVYIHVCTSWEVVKKRSFSCMYACKLTRLYRIA